MAEEPTLLDKIVAAVRRLGHLPEYGELRITWHVGKPIQTEVVDKQRHEDLKA